MKDFLKQMVEGVENPHRGRCLVREYLQARLLQTLQECHAFRTWAFVGGTALRFLYNLPRFSEDLDFSLHGGKSEDRFRDVLLTTKKVFLAEGYEVVIKLKDAKVVQSAFVRFPGLLFELGLSPLTSEVLAIKVEIDTNPPLHAITATTVVRKHALLNIHHYDRASLLAGKLHAVFTRKYTKGRDLYDLVWYLADRTWPEPNVDLLNSALEQSQWGGAFPTLETWRLLLSDRLAKLDWLAAVEDVRPFLERPEEVSLLKQEHIEGLLANP